MPYTYDAFADSRYGGALLRYVLDGIDTNPSYFQRLLVGAPQYIAYGLDRLGYADAPQPSTPYTTGEMNVGSRLTYNRYRPAGLGGYPNRKVRTLRRTKRYGKVAAVVRANWRTRKNLPLTIAHEENTEVRAKAGTQAIIQFQAERRLPLEQTASGTTPAAANGSLNPGVNRRSDNSLGKYNIGEAGTGLLFNQHMKYINKTDEERTVTFMNHRTDWTMFTNASWRDGYSALNGRFNTTATGFAGYITPVCTATPDAIYYQRNLGDVRNATDFNLPLTQLQAVDYHHLYEELVITVTNNAVNPTTVTLYECILNHDVQFSTTGSITEEVSTFTTQWGALPCPIELWRASRKFGSNPIGTITPLEGGVGIVPQSAPAQGAPIDDDDGEGATGTVMGIDLEARPSGYSGGAMTGANGTVTAPTTIKDIDVAGVRVGGQLLHHWYTVKPHKRTLQPGQTTTFSIKVVYNKRIPGTWWESIIGAAGYSRTFFMINRPHPGVGTTGLDAVGSSGPGSRFPASGINDLVMKWTKRKSFCRHDAMPRRTITYPATHPVVDAWVTREPDGDAAGDELMAEDGNVGGDGPPGV